MISEKDKEVIIRSAQKYKAYAIILFGSSVRTGSEANDIDIGVKGVEPKVFFIFMVN